jgi:branched-chain amino acid transport system ATP-binding protein
VTDEELLVTEDLCKDFGAVTAVDGVSLEIYDEFTTLIGPNGAGKTTFFNLLAGTHEPTAGRVSLQGEDVTDLSSDERTHRGLGRTYQVTNLFDELSAFENVRLAVQAVERPSHLNVFADALNDEEITERAHDVLDRLGFDETRTTAAQNLSQGYKRLLEIGIALATDPDILLLDEPTAGLAIDKKTQLFDVVANIASGRAVLLIEHKLDVVREFSDRLLVMHRGSILASGEPQVVLADDDVQDAYLKGANR